MLNSKMTQELTVMTQNESGILGLILEALHKKDIQIHSIVGRAFNGQAYFYIVSDNVVAAQKVLKADSELSRALLGIEVHDVVSLISDEDMSLPMVRFTSLLAKKDVQIDHCYSTFVNGVPTFVLATADNKLALQLSADAAIAA